MTEVILIAVVPCFCLFCWSLFDSEFRKSLLAAPNQDQSGSINPVFGLIKMEDGMVMSLQSEGQLRFWDAAIMKSVGGIQSELSEIRCGAYSPQARLIAVGSAMGKLEVRHLDQPDVAVTSSVSDQHEISCCQFTPDGTRLICGGEGAYVSIWDPRTLDRLELIEMPEPEDSIRSLTLTADGETLYVGTHSGQIQIWNLAAKSLVRKFQITESRLRPEASIEGVFILPESQEIIVATRVEGASVWNVETGERVRRLDNPLKGTRSSSMSADGNYFFAGSDEGELVTWDVVTGSRIKSVRQRSTIVRSVASDHEGRIVMTGDWSGQIQSHYR